jgi:hypothetical protein
MFSGRHCGVLGATGGGKSWTIATLLHRIKAAGGRAVLFDPTGEFGDIPAISKHYTFNHAEGTAQVVYFPYQSMTENDLITLVRPSGQSQGPRLRDAIKSLSQDGIDTTTFGGRLIFTIFNAIAEFEREIICERARAGRDSARSRGRKGGRPPALSATDLAKAKAKAMLRDPALTVEDVARTLGVGPATLYRHLPGGRSAVSEAAA